jgi:glycosyltransferase involved in cell wall biosynthesis
MTSLSVVVPVHMPREDYIDIFFNRCMKSLSEQTYKNFNLIIVINGIVNYGKNISILTEKINNIQNKFINPIKTIKYDTGLGVSRAMNIGIDATNTKFIALQAQDDFSLPERFEKQMNVLNSDDTIDVCGGGMKYGVDGNLKIHNAYEGNFSEFRKKILEQNVLSAGSVIFKRNLFYEVGKFNENLTVKEPYEDYDLWKKFALNNANFKNIQEPLYIWYNDYSTFEYYKKNN